MRKYPVFILFLTLFIVFSVPIMAECTEKLSVDERSLTEAQEWWKPDMSPYIHLWDPFTPVELPDQTWFRVFELPEEFTPDTYSIVGKAPTAVVEDGLISVYLPQE